MKKKIKKANIILNINEYECHFYQTDKWIKNLLDDIFDNAKLLRTIDNQSEKNDLLIISNEKRKRKMK